MKKVSEHAKYLSLNKKEKGGFFKRIKTDKHQYQLQLTKYQANKGDKLGLRCTRNARLSMCLIKLQKTRPLYDLRIIMSISIYVSPMTLVILYIF